MQSAELDAQPFGYHFGSSAGFDITLGEFFDDPTFDSLEQEIR